jgi:hypothetical protein
MKRKTTQRLTCEVTVKLPVLGLTQKQMKALKKGFKNILVATLGPTGKVIETRPVSKLVSKSPHVSKSPAIRRTRKTVKKIKRA